MFSTEFDRVLWCILEADSKNRDEIIAFLRELPEELIESIGQDLVCIDDNLDERNSEDISFYDCDEITGSDGMVYLYGTSAGFKENAIVLKKGFSEPPKDCEFFVNLGVRLNLINEYLPGSMEKIGSFTHYIDIVSKKPLVSVEEGYEPFFKVIDGVRWYGYTKECEVEYTLIDENSGHIVGICDESQDESSFIPINLDELPDELSMDYIEKRYGDGMGSKTLSNNN